MSHSLDLRDLWIRAFHCWGANGFVREATFWLPKKVKGFWIDVFISFTKMVRYNDFGRCIIPGFLIVVVDVVVVAAAASALGSRLPVLRVCVGEQHLGCFHPALVAGLHTWLVHGLFDRHLGSWDAFTHSDNACISLFGLEVFQTQISNARPLHPHADLRKYSLRWIFIGMDIHGDGYFFHFPSQLFVQIKMI